MAARRVSLPSADDLFRPTKDGDAPRQARGAEPEQATATEPAGPAGTAEGQPGSKRPSGRIRHDEKMTVYVTSEELMELEHARLTLRREFGLAVDRGRLVRHAIAIALAELESEGADCALVHRLTED